MNNYFQLSTEDQQLVLQQASARLGLPAQAIEKDLWVTTILQIVFTLPFADKLIFKGGTSLSKVWHQIERFSEDIDLAVDRSLFGMEGDLTKKQMYDLSRMMNKDFALAAIQDDGLWESIRHHREIFTSVRGMDYTQDVRKRITLIPPDDIRAAWEQDYKSMCSSMIFGDKPTFEELLEQMQLLEARFREA